MSSKTAFFPCKEYDDMFKFFNTETIVVEENDE
jgi:hypothetical protein